MDWDALLFPVFYGVADKPSTFWSVPEVPCLSKRIAWDLDSYPEWLINLIPQSLRTFIHSNYSSTADFVQQLLQFFKDLHYVGSYSDRLIEYISFGTLLKSCIRQAICHIFLEMLFLSCVVNLFLFEYLMGYIQRGLWATYSDTSWEFRATYVSIELRLAAYFWFKFRAWPAQPSSSERGRKRTRAELKGTPSVSERNERNKFEPRLKAKVHNGDKRMVSVWLGEYDTPQEAAEVYWIGAYYYNRWDRINDDVLSWCRATLPPIAPSLAVEEKRNVVRRHAEDYLIQRRRCVGQEGLAAEPHQGAGYVDPVVTPGTVEGGVLSPGNDFLLPSSHPDFAAIGLGQRDDEGNIIIEDYSVGDCSLRLGEVFGQGSGIEGLNMLGPYLDSNACQQQDIQDLQQGCGSAIALDGGGAEVGGIMTQDGTDLVHSDSRESADLTNIVDLPIDAHELRFTDTIQSTFRELRERGWDFELLPIDSTESFSVTFSNCEDRRKRPKLTGSNYLAFQEIHEQGFKIILKPLTDATTQDATGRHPSGSNSQALRQLFLDLPPTSLLSAQFMSRLSKEEIKACDFSTYFEPKTNYEGLVPHTETMDLRDYAVNEFDNYYAA